ncbi:MAG: hypothetical protein PHP48_11790 [Bacteroidales bacterium]|nr:hypothetical protein [Bacteroidales bacterium]
MTIRDVIRSHRRIVLTTKTLGQLLVTSRDYTNRCFICRQVYISYQYPDDAKRLNCLNYHAIPVYSDIEQYSRLRSITFCGLAIPAYFPP